jgi:serine/threonine protein kinase
MEYVSGGELFQLIKKYKRLTEDMVVFYLAEVTKIH